MNNHTRDATIYIPPPPIEIECVPSKLHKLVLHISLLNQTLNSARKQYTSLSESWGFQNLLSYTYFWKKKKQCKRKKTRQRDPEKLAYEMSGRERSACERNNALHGILIWCDTMLPPTTAGDLEHLQQVVYNIHHLGNYILAVLALF
jgi:hypothetical protein